MHNASYKTSNFSISVRHFIHFSRFLPKIRVLLVLFWEITFLNDKTEHMKASRLVKHVPSNLGCEVEEHINHFFKSCPILEQTHFHF